VPAATSFGTLAINAINAARSTGLYCGSTWYPAVPPVAWNDKLAAAALVESTWMQSNNTFSHVWPDGTDPGQRLTNAGYSWSAYGENIAAGQPDLNSVMSAWLQSSGHCANIMGAAYTDAAIASVAGTSSNTYSIYWTMELAAPQ
jgi:uncharacterized protein YkwD